jgi:hypothetical protein
MPKEGEDPIDEETRQAMAKKLRLKLLTRAFYVEKEKKKEKKKFKAT